LRHLCPESDHISQEQLTGPRLNSLMTTDTI
jgi:hypothetical protein